MEHKTRLLMIDDEESFTRLSKMLLEDEGYRVETLNDPTNAVQVAATFKPDIIILDVIMPEKSGIEVGHALQKNIQTQDIPILFLTAAVSKDNHASWESGVEGISYKIKEDILLNSPVLVKPVDAGEIMAKVQEILAK
ncbi:MAG: CheY-like chemotaxis protein [Kiritimatiellia bacterium]|jgi:CheY-like chemotaxis protein